MSRLITVMFVLLVLYSFYGKQSGAVQIGQNGLGEVLIYPYYTVNNNFNTLYSVVNTTPDTKAIRMRFLEGDVGLEVSIFDIYLSAFDVWTGALIPGTSSISGHLGEPSVIHLTSDTSCAPFLIKSGQEFFPFELDTDLDFDNRSMERSRQGYIEVIEMTTFNGLTIPAADHGTVGVPSDCAAIEADWAPDGNYDILADEQAPTGGLFGSATLVNVAEGLAFSYDAIALQNFWQGEVMLTEPGSLEPNLNAAFPQSTVLLDNGELAVSEWEHGFQAVSAVLTKSLVFNDYVLDTVVAGRTEWVFTFPTKGFHVNNRILPANDESSVLAPFANAWDGSSACDRYDLGLWGREETFSSSASCFLEFGNLLCLSMCKTNNVIGFSSFGEPSSEQSKILGDGYPTINIGFLGRESESGWGQLEFIDAITPVPLSGSGLKGFPVTGFAVQQFTNAGAAEGLLAQYGGLFMHKGLVVADDEVVD